MHACGLKLSRLFCLGLLACTAVAGPGPAPGSVAAVPETDPQAFEVKGVIREVRFQDRTLIVEHNAIPNYMPAMTMPFEVAHAAELNGLHKGDTISFRLTVSENESWIDRIVRTGRVNLAGSESAASSKGELSTSTVRHPLMSFKFTNELGQAVRLGEFDGQALAITFFFTRCPIPDYCPRLSKNFAEASQALSAMPDAPTNWHFLSVTFDPEFDTPAVLKAYGDRYHYDPKRWSFLTGPVDKLTELARQSDVTVQRESGLINHNFRTLIIAANGKLQTVFPIGGDLSEPIVSEMLKAAASTNRTNDTR